MIFIGLLCSCSSDHIIITYEYGDICITRQMYSRYSILSYSSSTCSDAGQIIIKEWEGEYEVVLAIDTCQNTVYVVCENSCKGLIPKHINTNVWRVQTHDSCSLAKTYGEQQIVYLDYNLSREMYRNSGFYYARETRQNTQWNIHYPNYSSWNIDDFGYIGGISQPSVCLPNAIDSALVLHFVESELKNLQSVSLSNYKYDCMWDIRERGCDGCQLFHLFYECANENGEIILVKDSANNIIDYLNIVLQSLDTVQQSGHDIIYMCRSRVNSREYYTSVSVETNHIYLEYLCAKSRDTIITRMQYDLIDGHYISHPVKDILVYEKP